MECMIKKLFLLLCLMILLPMSASAAFKGLHPPMEIEPELLGPPMIFNKGDCFEMGDTFGDGAKWEKPVHTVCLDDFYIGKYEVTQAEWFFVMGNNPSVFKGCDNCPVDSVNWDDVQGFIIKLNSKTGKNYRLPTEAEWEYSARSGGKKEKYAGVSEESQLYLYANFCDSNCKFDWKTNNQNDGYKDTSPVGSYRPNGLGLYDMTGNVWEWVGDSYLEYKEGYYGNSPKNNPSLFPSLPSSAYLRVLRGGSWTSDVEHVRASNRYVHIPSSRGVDMGFRLALSPK